MPVVASQRGPTEYHQEEEMGEHGTGWSSLGLQSVVL